MRSMGKDSVHPARPDHETVRQRTGSSAITLSTAHAVNPRGDFYPIHRRDLRVPLRPGLIINNPQRKLPEEQRAEIFEANDRQIVDAAQPGPLRSCPEFRPARVAVHELPALDLKTVIGGLRSTSRRRWISSA